MERKNFLKFIGILPLINIGLTSKAAKVGDGVEGAICKTNRDAEGPFYKAKAPERTVIETDGTPLTIEGKVLSGTDCKTPVANAIIDVWHCRKNGEYDMEGFNGRGQLKTDAKGNYSFTTIFPPPYSGRPRHIHFKIRANDFKELTTQLYFEGDPNIQNDFARNAEKSRVIALSGSNDVKKGIFNIYL
jgi:catechol 1,2-dioxygenase